MLPGKIIRRIAISICLCFLLTGWARAQEIREVKITDLEKIIAESQHPVIINFWATWCRPCLEEIPWFQEEVKGYERDSLELLLVSVDFKEEFPGGIATLAKKRNLTAPIFWLNETNADYFCPKIDPKWSGAVPASLFVNNKTGYRKFIEEELPREKLRKEIMAILSPR